MAGASLGVLFGYLSLDALQWIGFTDLPRANEIHVDAVRKGEKILLVDDLIATGGTATAAIKLLERAGAEVVLCAFVIDLPDLGGAAKLRSMGKDVVALVAFEGH